MDALQADCERCAGLCCVAPAFGRSADFAIDKRAGEPCPNLAGDFRCSIHERLRPSGFPGCAAYDCFGAGQHVTQVTFRGRDWRSAPEDAAQMFDAFAVMRDLHELLWHVRAALAPPTGLEPELREVRGDLETLAGLPAVELVAVDRPHHRRRVNELLLRVSAIVRGNGPDFTGRDLLGHDLRGADLRRALLFGACLIGADLRDADLSGADVRAADFRGADLTGADLTGCLFLTKSQLDSTRH